jgi:hypothetical protein
MRRWRNVLLRRVFELGQRVRFDILPRHFYSGVPDIAALKAAGRDGRWTAPRSMEGIAGSDVSGQLQFVRECCPSTLSPQVYDTRVHQQACGENGVPGYGPVEAAFLYCFTATKRPSRVMQVGCGVSTAVMLHAAQDHHHEITVTCVEPYPTQYLIDKHAAGEITLIRERAQDLPAARLSQQLQAGDLLFIDSTHAVKAGSEVNFVILDVLGQLPVGVFVHFHDIWFPYDYSPTILSGDLFFWNETALLMAFLSHNPRFAIAASLSMLHHANPALLHETLPLYRPAPFDRGIALTTEEGMHFPSSAFLQVVA